MAAAFRGLGMHSAAGAPILVEGGLWGVILAYWRDSQAVPPDNDGRMAARACGNGVRSELTPLGSTQQP